MSRLGHVAGIAVLGLAIPGCAGGPTDDEQTGRASQEVQLDRHGTYYKVSLAPVGATSLAERGTATALIPSRKPDGSVVTAIDGTPIRGTCGVTFISGKHAITAAHCVASDAVQDPEKHLVAVQFYLPKYNLNWLPAVRAHA